MDSCPAEVLHAMCALLSPKDVAAVRLVSQGLAAIGAHHLVDTVRFHTSPTSVKRLTRMSEHPIFSYSVRKLQWEASTLESEMTLPQLREVMQRAATAKVRGETKPKIPPAGASLREHRLFRRNLAKWTSDAKETEQNIRSQFRKYKRLVASESEAVDALLYPHQPLVDAIRRFPRLKELHFDNDPTKCHHMFSQRFGARFDQVEFPPQFDRDTGSTIWQIRELLLGIAASKSALEKLFVNSMAPSFFQYLSVSDLKTIYEALGSLKRITLTFRLDDEHEHVDDGGCFGILNRGGLRDMLAASPLLEHLAVRFDHYPEGGVTTLSNIVGKVAWPRLKALWLSQLSTTEDELMACLVRQTSLEDVAIGCMTLTKGSWENTVERMQKELSLGSAEFDGFLASEDTDTPEYWNTDMWSPLPLDVDLSDMDVMDDDDLFDVMMDEREHLASMLDVYITVGDEGWANPFYAYEWTDDEM